MKNNKLIYTFSTIVILSFTACSDDDDNGNLDTEKPVIVLNEPTDDEVFHAGEEIHLDADFSDNVALASYKIEIHSASDGHTHKNEEEGEWFYTETNEIPGDLRNHHVHKHIDIPLEVNGSPILEGHYHLGIFLVDKAGNEQQLFIEIEIHEPH